MAITLIPASTRRNTQTIGNTTVYLDPRISVNQMAQYMVAGHSRQEAIVRDAKFANKLKLANYQFARVAVSKCHSETGLSETAMLDEVARMKALEIDDAFEKECNRVSTAALENLASFVSTINCAGVKITKPQRGFDHLLIEGVRISVQPEIVFTVQHRGQTKYGGLMVNFTKGESSSLDRESGRHHAGDYAALLIFQMLALHYQEPSVRYPLCVAADAYRQKFFVAPTAHVTMLRDIAAACRGIARTWPDLLPEE